MAITTRSSMLGFLLALAALGAGPACADGPVKESPLDGASSTTVDARLSRIATALRARAEDPGLERPGPADALLAFGWADGRGNRGWVNTRYGGAARGRHGSWGNARRYYGGPRRVFANGGGGFYNGSYRPRGTFVNW